MVTYATPSDTGSLSTTILSNRIPIEMSPDISRKLGDVAPFTLLLERLPTKTVKTKKFEWMERDDLDNTVSTAANNGTGTTITLTTTEVKKVRVNDLLYYAAGPEMMVVTAVNYSTGVVTVTRGVGSTSAVAIDGSTTAINLIIAGNAMEEFSNTRKLMAVQPEAKYNYVQHLRDPFGVSGRLNATQLIGPSEIEFLQEDIYRNHYMQKEIALLFGIRSADSSQTTTGGIKELGLSASGSFTKDVSGTMTLGEWLAFCQDAGQYGSPDKLFVCGEDVIQAINYFAYDKLEVDMQLKEYGLNIMRFNAPSVSLMILHHKMFDRLGLNGEGWCIDIGALNICGLQGRTETVLNTGPNGMGIQDNDQDGTIYEWTCEFGLELRHPERHGRLYGANGLSSTSSSPS